ncbi:MAG: hypothetical protein ACD_8C00095G0001 [uncultured bacterium]|nr:MAG: hypothetical protein ACD_8C00095G0001 [uncultured bacterium]
MKRSIPYRIIGGIKFYQRKEVKDIVAYLRLISNPTDMISLERAINEPKRNIGDVTLRKWIEISRRAGLDFIETGSQAQILSAASEKNKLVASKIDAIVKFSEFIKRMKDVQKRISLSDFIEKVFQESGYEKMLSADGSEGEMRSENVRELISVAKKYDEMKEDYEDLLSAFLEEVALASDADNVDQNQDAVHLMTLHSAKGLEFPVVFIVGLEEGILPHSRSLLSAAEMEEERRLMYVGLTRAKEKIYLLFTRQRTLFGSTQMNSPSRFLDDIPEKLMKKNSYRENEQKVFENLLQRQKESTGFGRKNGSSGGAIFKGGERVSHEIFGDGLVISVVEDTITVAFKKAGIKRLSAEYANLKKNS